MRFGHRKGDCGGLLELMPSAVLEQLVIAEKWNEKERLDSVYNIISNTAKDGRHVTLNAVMGHPTLVVHKERIHDHIIEVHTLQRSQGDGEEVSSLL